MKPVRGRGPKIVVEVKPDKLMGALTRYGRVAVCRGDREGAKCTTFVRAGIRGVERGKPPVACPFTGAPCPRRTE